MPEEHIIETREKPPWQLRPILGLALIEVRELWLGWKASSKLDAKASSDELKNVDTKVGGVRADLDTTRDDLKMARSEMGTLIARNHEEIEQLRRLGERDYVECTMAGKNKPQKVGNVTVELKGVNQKRNQYSVAMTVEDK